MELLFVVKKFGKGQTGRWEPDGQGITYIESSLLKCPHFQQELASLVTGTATNMHTVAEAGTRRDAGRQASSFDKRAQQAALLPGTEPSCSGDRGNWRTVSQLLLWYDGGKVPRLAAQKTH